MRVLTKEIRDCKFEDGNEVKVLELTYSHNGENGKILVQNYDDKNYEAILSQLKKEVSELYKSNVRLV